MKMTVREFLFRNMKNSGCSDHNCVVTGKRTGMGTNGGCHCLLNMTRSQLTILQSHISAIADQEIDINNKSVHKD